MNFFTIVFLIILLSCNTKQGKVNGIKKTGVTENLKPDIFFLHKKKQDTLNTAILETFADSLNIGKKGKCKIELVKHRVYDDTYVIIKFYIKGRNSIKDPESWMIQNNYSYKTNALMGFDPNISDFNNDGLSDITFISGSAARGANEVRRLFIYDDQKQNLISIVNSEDYPNLLYNKELDCIDAFLVYGGCSTVFLNIRGDSLKKFASVELNNGLTVSTFDKNEKEKIIMKDKTNEAGYIRYKNFKSLKEYDNY
jgi:hypothetical protein